MGAPRGLFMLRKSIAEQTRIVVPTLDVFLKHYTDSKYVKTEFENLVKNGTLIPFFAFFRANLQIVQKGV